MEMKSGTRHLVVVIMMKVVPFNKLQTVDLLLQVSLILSEMVTLMYGL